MLVTLREAGNENIEYLVYPKLDRKFNHTNGECGLKEVVIAMHEWLTSILKNSE